MLVGTRFEARHFPRRKRIISGIFRGFVIIEAAPKSGFIITACSVLEQNRGVFAMPGSPADPRARGTNNLIQQEALLRKTIFNVLNVINPNPRIHVSPMAQVYGALNQIIPVTDDVETKKVRGLFDTVIQITNIGIF